MSILNLKDLENWTAFCSPKILLAVTLPLSGCANFADSMAPKHYNTPWKPGKHDLGATLPVAPTIASELGTQKNGVKGKAKGKPGDLPTVVEDDTPIKKRKGLVLPKGYTLPSVKSIRDQVASKRAEETVITNKKYGLVDLIDVAQSSNPKTRQAWNTALNQALEMGITRASYLPQITGTVLGGYAHSVTHSREHINGHIKNNPFHLNETEVEEDVSMRWLLFDYGRRSTMRAQQELAIASNVAFTGVHQKVIFDVAQAYYTYNAALKHHYYAQLAYKNASKVNDIVQARFRSGQASLVDTSQTKAALATAELAVVRAKNEVSDDYLTLLNAMGINPQTEIKIKPRNLGILSTQDLKITKDLVHEAVARRPDVVQAMSQFKASKHMINAAIGAFLPQIFLSGQAGHRNANGLLRGQDLTQDGLSASTPGNMRFSKGSFTSNIAGGITMPLFDGGTRLAELKESKNKARSAAERLREIENEAIREIVVAQNGVENGYTSWRASRRANEAAQTGFDAGLAAYRSGYGNLNRLIDLQNDLFKAQIGQSDAYYGSLVAAASLAYATGTLGSADVLDTPDFGSLDDDED